MVNSTFQMIEDCEATNKALYKFYAAVMIVIFILALPLNASVLHLFIFKLKFWKTNTNNVFLFNLVLADILLLFCLPIKAHNFIKGERRSEDDTVCKAMLFMLFLNRGASIAFLTVTSIDRYFNVVHPGRKNLLKALKKSPQISILIWLLLLPLTVPTMLKNFECCNSHKASNDDTLIKVTPKQTRPPNFPLALRSSQLPRGLDSHFVVESHTRSRKNFATPGCHGKRLAESAKSVGWEACVSTLSPLSSNSASFSLSFLRNPEILYFARVSQSSGRRGALWENTSGYDWTSSSG